MRRLLLLPVIALVALFVGVAPASAATVESVEPRDPFTGEVVTEIRVGQSVDVVWEAISDEPLVELSSTPALDDFSDFAEAQGSLTVTPETVGTHTFTVTATDDDGEASLSATLEVLPEEEITPDPVTFPEPCVVVIPDGAGYFYSFDFGGFGDLIDDTGRRNLSDFYNDGNLVVFRAIARPGFTFAPGAETDFDVTVSEDCLPNLLAVTTICKGVTFENVTDTPVALRYTASDDGDDDVDSDELVVAPGATFQLDTPRTEVYYEALPVDDAEAPEQRELVEVEQDCVRPVAAERFPTVAPAAGEGGSSSTNAVAAALGGVALLATVGLALRRRTA